MKPPRVAFDVLDPSTWPLVLTTGQVAAIYQRSDGGLRKACQKGQFIPAPYKRRPWLWRKVDVLRDVEGARGMSLSTRRAG